MSTLRVIVIVIAAVVGLAVLRFRPWERTAVTPGEAGRQKLTVGFLPVT